MQPSQGSRYHASIGSWTIALLIASALVVIATASFESLRTDWVLVIIATLTGALGLGIVAELLLHFLAGPRSYVLDESGLSFGRGKRLTPLFKWQEVSAWTLIEGDKSNDRWKFETADKTFTVRKVDVRVPSAGEFAREVERLIGKPPEGAA